MCVEPTLWPAALPEKTGYVESSRTSIAMGYQLQNIKSSLNSNPFLMFLIATGKYQVSNFGKRNFAQVQLTNCEEGVNFIGGGDR